MNLHLTKYNSNTHGSNAFLFMLNYEDVFYKIEELIDNDGLVQYIITSKSKKIASMYLQENGYGFDMHPGGVAGEDLLNFVHKKIKEKISDELINADNLLLSAAEFYRLNFEEHAFDHWSDKEGKFNLKKNADNSYAHYTKDANAQYIYIGISLKTVADLQRRYVSVTGQQLNRINVR